MPTGYRSARASDNPVPIDQLVIPEWDIRDHRPPEDVMAVQASLQEEGQIMPVLLSEREDGLFDLVDGVHRYLAAKQAEWDRLDGIVLSPETDDYTAGVIANLSRVDLQSYDKLNVFNFLFNVQDLDYQVVADKLGISERTARRWRQVLRAPDEVVQMVVQEDIPITAGSALAEVPDADRAVEIAETAVLHDWGADTIKTQARNAKQDLERAQSVQEAVDNPTDVPDGVGTDARETDLQDVESPAETADREKAEARDAARPDPTDAPADGPEDDAPAAPVDPPESVQAPHSPPDETGGPECFICSVPVDPNQASIMQWGDDIAEELGAAHSPLCRDHGIAFASYLGDLLTDHAEADEPAADPED